jgi:hypothetical protein
MKSYEIKGVRAEIEAQSGFTPSFAVDIVGIPFSGKQTQELRLSCLVDIRKEKWIR